MVSGFTDKESGLSLTLTDKQINEVNTNCAQKGKESILSEPYYYSRYILYLIGGSSGIEFFQYGKGRSGWWDCGIIIRQLNLDMNCAEVAYPNC